jgi:hypothetical protein
VTRCLGRETFLLTVHHLHARVTHSYWWPCWSVRRLSRGRGGHARRHCCSLFSRILCTCTERRHQGASAPVVAECAQRDRLWASQQAHERNADGDTRPALSAP